MRPNTSQLITDRKSYITNSPLLKLNLGLPPGLAFEGGVSEDVLVDDGFVQRNIHRVSEGTDSSRRLDSDVTKRRYTVFSLGQILSEHFITRLF